MVGCANCGKRTRLQAEDSQRGREPGRVLDLGCEVSVLPRRYASDVGQTSGSAESVRSTYPSRGVPSGENPCWVASGEKPEWACFLRLLFEVHD